MDEDNRKQRATKEELLKIAESLKLKENSKQHARLRNSSQPVNSSNLDVEDPDSDEVDEEGWVVMNKEKK